MAAIPPNQTLKIPERYAKLGVRQGFEPTPPDELRMIIEGEAGHGKTQFLMSMPDVLVFDFDKACQDAIRQKAQYCRILSWNDYLVLKNSLIEDAKAGHRPVKRVAFDTVDLALAMLDRYLIIDINKRRIANDKSPLLSITEYGESGAGYTKLKDAMLRELWDFEQAGYPYILLAHMRVDVEIINNKRYVERRSVMPPSVMKALVRAADMKVRIIRSMDNVNLTAKRTLKDSKGGEKVIETPTGKTSVEMQYWLRCMPTDASDETNDTKRRIPYFKGAVKLPLVDGYKAFEASYNAAIVQARQKTGEDTATAT